MQVKPSPSRVKAVALNTVNLAFCSLLLGTSTYIILTLFLALLLACL